MSTLTTLKINDLSSMRIVDLKAICRENGLKGFSKLCKADLVYFLSENILQAVAAELAEQDKPEQGVIKLHQRTPHQVQNNPLEKAYFTIGETTVAYEGFTLGGYWNGWACPMFTDDVAIQILQDCTNSISDKVWFDAENNCFCAHFDGALEEVEIYEGKEYEYEGKTYMLYDIGAYSWVWDKVKLDDNYEYRYFHNDMCEFMNIDGTFSKAEDVFDKAVQF
jgi:hypothetical protein